MIMLNGRQCNWQPGLTVEKLLEIEKFTYPRITVIINKDIVQPEDYNSTIINDGDEVQVVHLMAGG